MMSSSYPATQTSTTEPDHHVHTKGATFDGSSSLTRTVTSSEKSLAPPASQSRGPSPVFDAKSFFSFAAPAPSSVVSTGSGQPPSLQPVGAPVSSSSPASAALAPMVEPSSNNTSSRTSVNWSYAPSAASPTSGTTSTAPSSINTTKNANVTVGGSGFQIPESPTTPNSKTTVIPISTQNSPMPMPTFSVGSYDATSPRLGPSASGRRALKSILANRSSSCGSSSTKDGNAGDNGILNQRRQKRLERNRESARLSRRRRKQYLEVLEDRVTTLSEEMDKGRREHVLIAVRTIRSMRKEKLSEIERDLGVDLGKLDLGGGVAAALETKHGDVNIPLLEHHARALDSPLSRTCDELRIASTFLTQQLKSLAAAPSTKFILWLTLQNEVYFRGGRAASERLSAARIGERMLHSGNDRASPSNCMWPLFCNEVGLSYDQEERFRSFQRKLLANHQSWLNRHSIAATCNLINSINSAILGINEMVQQRERAVLNVLSVEQRALFLAWAERRGDRIARLAKKSGRAPTFSKNNKTSLEDALHAAPQTSQERHEAANLYIVNHHVQTVSHMLPTVPSIVPAASLKRLSRRPSFESLAGSTASLESASSRKLSRDNSFPSTGSLKRTLSEQSCTSSGAPGGGEDMDTSGEKSSVPSITPEAAQAAAAPVLAAALGPVGNIIPPVQPSHSVSVPSTSPPQPQRIENQYYYPQQQPQYATLPPQPAAVQSLTVTPNPVSYPDASFHQEDVAHYFPQALPQFHPSESNFSGTSVTVPGLTTNATSQNCAAEFKGVAQTEHSTAIQSLLPTHMNIVPEDGYLPNFTSGGPETSPEDILFELNEEDWAIGEGFDMDMS